jgi:uncharacterized protein (TIGR01370 family)
MNWSRLLPVVALMSSVSTGSIAARDRWAAYYSDQARPEEFRGYGLVVFDADRHPALEPLAAGGTTVLGYLSLGEIERHRAWFAEVRQMGILLGENRNWPGSYYVDLRDPGWQRIVIGRLVPALLTQGFRGVFLDTLDDPVELERLDPERCRGMAAAAIALVKELRRTFPSVTIMMNRGYALLAEVGGHIDIALGESVYGTYDFERKLYRAVPAAEYREQVQVLKQARKRNPALRICSLDYWDPADREGIRRIYREERANGFDPYVATDGLDQLLKEPR